MESPRVRSRTEAHKFPKVNVTKINSETEINLAPIVFNLTSRKDPQDVVAALRSGCKYTEVDNIVADLGLRDEGKYPLKVHTRQISFYGIPQILPLAVISKRYPKEQVLSSVGLIPLKPLELDGWKLGFEQRWGDDGGGGNIRVFNNFMERNEENSATFMRVWLTPYIERGLELNPSAWYGRFEYYAAKLNEKGSVQYYDRASVLAQFTPRGEGLDFYGKLEGSLSREVLSPDIKLKFEIGNPPCGSQAKHDSPRLVSEVKGMTYHPDVLKRMAESDFLHLQFPLSYEDLATASVFPNTSGVKREIDHSESLHCLLENFQGKDVDNLAGFNWLKFR